MTHYSEREARKLLLQSKIQNPQSEIELYLTGYKTKTVEESAGEAAFAHYWNILAPGYPPFLRDKEAILPEDDLPHRQKYRPDFRNGKIIVEIEGISHRLDRYVRDLWKYNHFAFWGYRLFRITHKELLANPDRFINLVKEAIDQAK